MIKELWWIVGCHLSLATHRSLARLYPTLFSADYWLFHSRQCREETHALAQLSSWTRVFHGTFNSSHHDQGLAYDREIIYDHYGGVWWKGKILLGCREVVWINDDLYYIDEDDDLHYVPTTEVDIVLQGEILHIHAFRDRVYILDVHYHVYQYHYEQFLSRLEVERETQPLIIQGHKVVAMAVTAGTHAYHNYCWHRTDEDICYCLSFYLDGTITFFAFYEGVTDLFALDEEHVLLLGRNRILRGNEEVSLPPHSVVVIHNVPFFFFGHELVSWTEYRKGEKGIRLVL